MDLPKSAVDLNLDNIDETLIWLQHNQPMNQIEKELEELFDYFHISNKKIESQLRKVTFEVSEIDYCSFRTLVEISRFETPSRQVQENIKSDLRLFSTQHLKLLRQAVQKSQLLNNFTAALGCISLSDRLRSDFLEFFDDFVLEKQKIITVRLNNLIDKITLIGHQQGN